MPNRRQVLISAGASLIGSTSSLLAADSMLLTGASAPQPALTPTEQLMYSTVRLVNQTPTMVRWGTGFIFALFHKDDLSVPVIVTNRHVVQDWEECSFSFAGRLPSGAPDLSNHIPVQISQFKTKWIPHPSIDLVIIPIQSILSDLQDRGHVPFIVTLDQSHIMTQQELEDLTPVEQILTVGFPGQLWDDVHNLPVFHHGYTATAPYIDFKGNKEFLIDVATWPGASGSPVMLFDQGTWVERDGKTIMGGIRVKLLGIVYGVAVQDISGNVLIQNAPTQILAQGQMQVPTNLGACLDASRILEFEPLLVSISHLTPPAGYVMRAQ